MPGRDRRGTADARTQQQAIDYAIDRLMPGLGTFEGLVTPSDVPDPAEETMDQSPVYANSTGRLCTALCDLTSGEHVSWYPESLRSQQRELLRHHNYQVPAHKIPDPQSSLSKEYTEFGNAVQQQLQLGRTIESIVGDTDPVVDLLFRPRTPSDALTNSLWACEVTKKLAPLDIYTQLGYVFLLSRLIRWCVTTTHKNWILMPPMMRPTNAQRWIPHYLSADIQPLSAVREALVYGRTTLDAPIGDLERAGTTSIKMSWPFGLDEAVELNPSTGQKVLSRLFQAAAADESNWSCGRDFMKDMPPGEVNVVTHQHGWERVEI